MAWLSRCKVVAVKVLARPHIFLPLLSVALVFYLHQQVPALLLQDPIIFLLSQLGNARASLAAARVEALEAAKVVSDVAAGLRSKGVRW